MLLSRCFFISILVLHSSVLFTMLKRPYTSGHKKLGFQPGRSCAQLDEAYSELIRNIEIGILRLEVDLCEISKKRKKVERFIGRLIEGVFLIDIAWKEIKNSKKNNTSKVQSEAMFAYYQRLGLLPSASLKQVRSQYKNFIEKCEKKVDESSQQLEALFSNGEKFEKQLVEMRQKADEIKMAWIKVKYSDSKT